MRLPERGRLFVGGISPSTGDAELRSHFRRFGEVSDICLPKDSITGRPRCFAFVQFIRPGDAARALADPHPHVIDGREVHIDKAQPRSRSSITPLCRRVLRWRNECYRVGDLMGIAIGPLPDDDCQGNEDVNQAKKFGAMVDKTLIFYCVIGYISQDGKECLVRWPPARIRDTQAGSVYGCRIDKSALPCQGSIVPSYDFRLKDLAQLSNRSLGGDDDARPWCWLML